MYPPPLPPPPQSGLNRNTSVEDFFSLVESGVVPPPDKDLLSKCVFPTSARQQPAAPQQSAVAFTGIGKSSAILPAAAAPSPGGGGGAKRARNGGGGNGSGGAEGGARAKQAKTES